MGYEKVQLIGDSNYVCNISKGYSTGEEYDEYGNKNVLLPFTSYGDYMAVGLPVAFHYNKVKSGGLLNKPVWTYADGSTEAIGRWKYMSRYAKANVKSWGNFSNLEYMTERIIELENQVKSNVVNPKAMDGIKGRSAKGAKELYKKLLNAKTLREYNAIVAKNKKTYELLLKHAPKELFNLQNKISYSHVLKNFTTARTHMLNTGKLPGHMTFDGLAKSFADARYGESLRIKTGGKAVKGLWGRGWAGTTRSLKAGLASSSKAGKALRFCSRNIVGKAGGAVMAVMTAATVYSDVKGAVSTAKEGDGFKDGARQLAKSGLRAGAELGGAWAGTKIGATIGSCFGPVGTLVGGLIGGAIGWIAGNYIANKSEFISTSVQEERKNEQDRKDKEMVAQAINKGDYETVYNYTNQFKEPILDEKGQPVVDENGQQAWRYIQVSEDEAKQKEFEARIQHLDNYVETEAAKAMQVEQLQAEAEAARQQGIVGSMTPDGYGGYIPYNQFQAGSDTGETETVWGYGVNGNGRSLTQQSVENGTYNWNFNNYGYQYGNMFDDSNIFAGNDTYGNNLFSTGTNMNWNNPFMFNYNQHKAA